MISYDSSEKSPAEPVQHRPLAPPGRGWGEGPATGAGLATTKRAIDVTASVSDSASMQIPLLPLDGGLGRARKWLQWSHFSVSGEGVKPHTLAMQPSPEGATP